MKPWIGTLLGGLIGWVVVIATHPTYREYLGFCMRFRFEECLFGPMIDLKVISGIFVSVIAIPFGMFIGFILTKYLLPLLNR